MGLWRVGGGLMVVDQPSSFGGGDSGNVVDSVMGGPSSGSLAPDLGARVLMGRPWSSTWILAVKRGLGHGDDIGIGKISNVSSSSSSAYPSLPSPVPMMETMGPLVTQSGWAMGPNDGWRMTFPNALLKSCSSLRSPSANRLIDLGRETVATPKP
jgi:hypothetical protein